MAIKNGLISMIDLDRRRKLPILVVSILLCYNLGMVSVEAVNSGRDEGDNQTPTAQIKFTIDRVLRILNDPGLQGDSQKNLRYRLARDVIIPRFDFNEIAKRSLGSYWRRLNPVERRRFVNVFTRFLEQAYVVKISAYNGEKFLYAGERVDQNFAEVISMITSAGGTRVTVRYKLRLVGPDWKIYDVVVEDISMVNNYRAQFARIIARSSYGGLVAMLEQKLTKR